MYGVYINGEIAIITDSVIFANMKASEIDHEFDLYRKYKGVKITVTVEKRK